MLTCQSVTLVLQTNVECLRRFTNVVFEVLVIFCRAYLFFVCLFVCLVSVSEILALQKKCFFQNKAFELERVSFQQTQLNNQTTGFEVTANFHHLVAD